MKYKSYRIIDGKPRWVVVDGNETIINRSPSKEELKSSLLWNFKHNETNTCNRCGINFDKATGNPLREYDKDGNKTKNWICKNCWHNIDYRKRSDSTNNIIKSLANCRTGSLDPNCITAKGNNSQKLACILYGWKDLNEENDNYNSSLDCYDPKTGLYHQVQGHYYNYIDGIWYFSGLEREWKKIYDNMICFCISKDGKIVERIYKFPKEEIMRITNIGITKNSSRASGWYEQYKVLDEKELERANEIWNEIINRKK